MQALLLEFFRKDAKLSDFIAEHDKTRLAFMEASCAICYVTFEKFLSNEAFSISGNLLRDMILDAVQGVLRSPIFWY